MPNNIPIGVNSTSTPLTNGSTFTGIAHTTEGYSSLVVSLKTDQSGLLYIDFSVDGVNWDSTLTYDIDADVNEVHRLTCTREYFRIRIYNNSGSNQTYLRAQSMLGDYNSLASPINIQIQSDADSIVVRPIDYNLAVSDGKFSGRSFTIKDGINPDIDTGTTPEDTWGGGGTYTGFPSAAEEGQIVVSGADTGTVYYSYMASSTDTDYTLGSRAIAGAGDYDLGHNVWRCNYAYFDSGSAANVGNITIRQKITTSNIFCQILAAQGQTFCGAYTVPYGSAIYIDRITSSIRGGNTGASADCFVWYRINGKSPVFRFPFVVTFGALYFDDVDYAIKVPALTDIIPRVTTVTANNTNIHVSYRIMKIKQ